MYDGECPVKSSSIARPSLLSGTFAGAVGEVAAIGEFEGQRVTLHHDASHQYPLVLSLVLSEKSQRWVNSKVTAPRRQPSVLPGTFAGAVGEVATVGEFEGQGVTLHHDETSLF